MPLLLTAQSDNAHQGIQFQQNLSWTQIKAKAQAENKYIFVDCYATWCGPCKMMDRDVYPKLHVGYALNEHFISIKVQIDSTANDHAHIKSWYADAQKLQQRYKITALPTFLFFSPAGDLVHKASGYMDAGSFIRLSNLARDPQKTLYYTQYKAYQQGKKEYPSMGGLALFTRDLIGDAALADAIAYDYKHNYLDKLDTTALYTKENINFIYKFPDLVQLKDNFFTLAYEASQRFDSIGDATGSANRLVHHTITREGIANKVLINGKAVNKMPDWDQLQSTIAEKYGSVDARKLVLTYKVAYYRDLFKDWTLWAKYKDEMIKAYPPKQPYGLSVYIEINGYGGAWYAFLHCMDTTVLLKALEWVDLALQMDGEDKITRAAYLDTKANLLYKLGRKAEALPMQKEALELTTANGGIPDDIRDAYYKMQRGEPTWEEQNY